MKELERLLEIQDKLHVVNDGELQDEECGNLTDHQYGQLDVILTAVEMLIIELDKESK